MQPAETRPGVAALPRRDRIAVLAGLAGVTAVAWAYLVLMAVRMQGMDGMDAAAAMRIRTAGLAMIATGAAALAGWLPL